MKCPNCRGQVRQTMRYCPYCGRNLAVSDQHKRKRVWYLLLSLSLFVAVLVILALAVSNHLLNDDRSRQLVDATPEPPAVTALGQQATSAAVEVEQAMLPVATQTAEPTVTVPTGPPLSTLPPPLADVHFPDEVTTYPADWPDVLRPPETFTLVETTSGPLLESAVTGRSAKLRFPHEPSVAAGQLEEFLKDIEWQIVERVDLGAGGLLLFIASSDNLGEGIVVIDPDQTEAGTSRIMVTFRAEATGQASATAQVAPTSFQSGLVDDFVRRLAIEGETAHAQNADMPASLSNSLSHQWLGGWTPYGESTSVYWYDIDMLSESYGWAVGSEPGGRNVLMHWNGREWQEFVSPVEATLFGVDMVSANDGWAVGYEGAILRWNGTEWTSVPSPTTQSLWSVSMVSATEGWAVGGFVPRPVTIGPEIGVILRWDGNVWRTVQSGPGNALRKVKMLSATTGWIVGNRGATLRWNGIDWEPIRSPTHLNLYSIDMVSPNYGWAVGGDAYGGTGVLLHWNGNTWLEVDSPIFWALLAVDLISETNGWAVGNHGSILHWDGQNWREVSNPTTGRFNSIAMISPSQGWIVGSNILRYEQEQHPVEPCGTWARQIPVIEKDARISSIFIHAESQPPCQASFRLINETDLLGYGGYTFELTTQTQNATASWRPALWPSHILAPVLDLELEAVPTHLDLHGQIAIRGDMTLTGVAVDTSLFLLRTGLAISPPTTQCFVDEETLLFAAIRVSNIVATTAELAFQGRYHAAHQELNQIGAHFYEASAGILVDVGLDCAADLLLEEVAKKLLVKARIIAHYLAWIPQVFWDYWQYEGLPAEVIFLYTPPLVEVTYTEVILLQPTTYSGEERDGSCWTYSLAAPRDGAWRCMVENSIHDPCFSSPVFANAVICKTSPDDDGGFKLNLTEPLPTHLNPPTRTSAWIFELADGATCGIVATGTNPLIEWTGRLIYYACDDGTQIEGELKVGQVWTAQRVRVDLRAEEPTVEELGEVTIRRVWR
jgi:photosystem II stability/assembly factor-like uncharacterized protein